MRSFLAAAVRGLSYAAIFAIAFGVAGVGPADAQSYPTRPIRIILPFAPGGGTDAVARTLGPKLSELLGQQFVVENMAGANGSVGLKFLSKAPADGYTLVMTSASPLVTNPHTFENMTYDPQTDFTYITTVAESETLLAVNPNVPAKNLDELMALSKTRELRFGLPGLGGQPQLILEKIRLDAGGKFKMVPYSATNAVADVVAGHIDGLVIDIPPLVPLVNDGQLKGIINLSKKPKSDFLSSVPTIGNNEKFRPYIFRSWTMFLGPANMPKDVTQKIRDAVVEALKDPELLEKFRRVSQLPLVSDSPAAATQFFKDEYEHFRQMVKETGVKVQN